MNTELRDRLLKSFGLFGAYEGVGYFFTSRLWPSESAGFFLWSIIGFAALTFYWVMVSQRQSVSARPDGSAPVLSSTTHSAAVPSAVRSSRGALALEPGRSVFVVLNADPENSSGLFESLGKQNGLTVRRSHDSNGVRVWELANQKCSASFVEVPAAGAESLAAIASVVAALQGSWWSRFWSGVKVFAVGHYPVGTQLRGIIAVCPVERFLSSKAGQLTTELVDAIDLVGSRLSAAVPIYVLLRAASTTPPDQERQIPHFHRWVQRLEPPMRSEVVGLTFDDVPEYRSSADFEKWLSRLTDQRLDVMARDTDLTSRCRLYEYPREWRKRQKLVSAFIEWLPTPATSNTATKSGRTIRGLYVFGTTFAGEDASGDLTQLQNEISLLMAA